LAHERD